jgi:23S rRNA pseudouridine955/2504/2580 synthase
MQEIKITEDVKLRKWFKDNYQNLTLSNLEKLLRTGQVRVNGKRVKLNHTLNEADKLRLPPFIDNYKSETNSRDKIKVSKKDINIIKEAIVFEDENYVAINKPYGLPSQGGSKVKISVIDIFNHWYDKEKLPSPKLVHRLDKNTTGVLLLAKNLNAAQDIGKQLKNKTTEKIYLAVTHGSWHKHKTKGKIEKPLEKQNGRLGQMMKVEEDGKPAMSLYEVITQNEKSAFIKLIPKTGRTHQLRVHTAEMGNPIIGDSKYGNRNLFSLDISTKNKLHLHSKEFNFTNLNGRVVKIKANLPDHFNQTLKELKLKAKMED